jgi:NADPH:quinone reductase-like Zn-dependent oxidoreductase
MKAAVIHSFGSADVLDLEELESPRPGRNEVRVKVHAASVNPVDYKIRSGKYPVLREKDLPVVLGRDVAGEVAECGEGVRRFRKGDEVYAMLDRKHGGYAEYTIVNENDLAGMPKGLGYAEAAAVPLAAITAWQGLFDHGELEPGQLVLIHGGAGGVGHFAVQFAKQRGATVATTVSRDDFDFVRSLGADRVIDYRAERFEDVIGDVDLVFDLVGGETQERSLSVLKRGGALVSTLSLSKSSEEKAAKLGVRATNYLAQPNGHELEEIARLIDSGQVRPHVEAVYPLADVRAAQRRLEEQHAQGKIVVSVA